MQRVVEKTKTQEESFTVKTEMHEACGFAYTIVRSDGETFGPVKYRGEDAVYVFLVNILEEERRIRADMENKNPFLMKPEDWRKYKSATECHICNKCLVKDLFLDSISVHDHDTGRY